MAQYPLVIQDGNGAAVLQAINNAILALATQNAGTSAPNPTYPFMLWPKTDTNELYMRNEADDAWVLLGTFDASQLAYLKIKDNVTTETGKAVFTTGNLPLNPRQTVLSCRVTGASPDYLTVSGLNVTLFASNEFPFMVTFAHGFDGIKPVVYNEILTNSVSNAWTLPKGRTVYLYIDRNLGTGALTYGYASKNFVFIDTLPTFVHDDGDYHDLRHFFSSSTMKMSGWDFSSDEWNEVQRVFLAKVVTNKTTVSSIEYFPIETDILETRYWDKTPRTMRSKVANLTQYRKSNPYQPGNQITIGEASMFAKVVEEYHEGFCDGILADANYFYVASYKEPGKIFKLAKADLSVAGVWTPPISYGGLYVWATDGVSIFVVEQRYQQVTYINKVDMDSMLTTATYTMPLAESTIVCMVPMNGVLYVSSGYDITQGKIFKLDIETFTQLGVTVTLPLNSRVCGLCGCTDGTYVYLPGYVGAGNPYNVALHKIDSALNLVGTFTAADTNQHPVGAIIYDTINGRIYMGTTSGSQASKIYKINPTNMTIVGSAITLPDNYAQCQTMALSADATTLYAASNKSAGDKILKIDTATFTVTTTTAVTPNYITHYGYYLDGTNLLVLQGGNWGSSSYPTLPAEVSWRDLTDPNYAIRNDMPKWYGLLDDCGGGAGYLYHDGKYFVAYGYVRQGVGTPTPYAIRMMKIDPWTFEKVMIVETVPSNVGRQSILCSFYGGGKYAYIWCTTPSGGDSSYHIYEIDNDTLLRTGREYVPADPAYHLWGDNEYLYYATYTSPFKVQKVRLSDMTLVGTYTAPGGKNNIRYGSFFDGRYMYCPTYSQGTMQSEIFKIDTSTMTSAGSFLTAQHEYHLGDPYFDGRYLYYGYEDYGTATGVIKVDTLTMTSGGTTWTCGDTMAYCNRGQIVSDGVNLYVPNGDAPILYKISMSSPLTLLGTFNLPYAYDGAGPVFIHCDGNYVWMYFSYSGQVRYYRRSLHMSWDKVEPY